MKNDVTVVMTTYNNHDFTSACCRVFKRYYPDVRIILADGGSTDKTTEDWNEYAEDIVMIPDGKIEDCRNAAAALVDTPFILTMDNDAKVIGQEALPMLMESMKLRDDIAQVGAYSMKVASWEEKRLYCSRYYSEPMECDFHPAYFCLHRTEAWHSIGGMGKEWPFGNPPFEVKSETQKYNNGGDAYITIQYHEKGWKSYTPKAEVPILHFVGAAWWSTDMDISHWWRDNHTICAINPLNDWEKYEKGELKL